MVRNIQIFIGFGNLYLLFIKQFSKIAALLISILQMTDDREKHNFKAESNDKANDGKIKKDNKKEKNRLD